MRASRVKAGWVLPKALIFILIGLVLLGSLHRASASSFYPPYSCYSSLSQIEARATALASASKGLASWEFIGSSTEARNIQVLRLGPRSSAVPQLIIVSALDANDLTSAQTNLAFAEWLLSDPQARPLLDLMQIHLFLGPNPDGRAMAEKKLTENHEPDWLGNTNTSTCPQGVRLERNFATNTFTAQLCGPDYGGPNRLSELETQTLDAYLRSLLGDPSALGQFAPPLSQGLLITLSGTSAGWSFPLAEDDNKLPVAAEGMRELATKLAAPVENPQKPAINLPGTWLDAQGQLPQAVYERHGLSSLSLRMHTGSPALPLECGSFAPAGLNASTVIRDYRAALYQAALAALNPASSAYGPEIIAQKLTRSLNQDLELSATANAYFPGLDTAPIRHIEYALADANATPLTAWTPLTPTSPPSDTNRQEAKISISKSLIPPGAKLLLLRAVNTNAQAGITQLRYIPGQASLPPIQTPIPPGKTQIFLPLLSR